MLLVLEVLAFVPPTVAKCVSSETIHLSVPPLATIDSPVLPLMHSESIDHITVPLAYEFRRVAPNINATAFFLAMRKFSEVFSTISPSLMALTMLHPVPPAAPVEGTIYLP